MQDGSAADRAGIRRGDAIVAINGQDVADSNELRNRIAQLGPDASVDLTIVRNGETQTVKATLEVLPSTTVANAGTNSPADERTAGLVVEPLTPQRARQMGLSDSGGLLVTGVDPNGPASQAGIRTGDVIQQVDGQALDSTEDLRRALSGGDRPALVLVRRGQQNVFVPLPRRG